MSSTAAASGAALAATQATPAAAASPFLGGFNSPHNVELIGRGVNRGRDFCYCLLLAGMHDAVIMADYHNRRMRRELAQVLAAADLNAQRGTLEQLRIPTPQEVIRPKNVEVLQMIVALEYALKPLTAALPPTAASPLIELAGRNILRDRDDNYYQLIAGLQSVLISQHAHNKKMRLELQKVLAAADLNSQRGFLDQIRTCIPLTQDILRHENAELLASILKVEAVLQQFDEPVAKNTPLVATTSPPLVATPSLFSPAVKK